MALSDVHARPGSGPVTRTALTENFALSERYYGAHTEFALHAHRKSYLIITLDGRFFSTFDHQTEEFKPWTVTYHQAGISHRSHYAEGGAKVLYVELPPDRIREFLGTGASHLTHFSLQGGLLEWTARQLYKELNTPDHLSPIVMDGLVMQLLAHLVRRGVGHTQYLPPWLGTAAEMIRSRFTEPLALMDIAHVVNVHRVHLAREYRRYFHCTIGEHVRRLRVEYACEQLSKTERSIADIALAAGFSDQSHLTVSFKQLIGTSPSHYRKTVKTPLLS